ncbi:Apolipoprotein O-like [Melipona quadrifasciata]|uniref:MICOS complex subunit n=1 Tax=Melipona quadrifasciata TaxID=166423 RepID=A0A0M9A3I2_9HYME|nr:Apolipoprotein O-like [Melipona quadrifasciata]
MHDYVHRFLESTIGNIFGKDVTCREPVHRCDDYQPGVLIEFGRTGIKLFKKFLMPCGLCAAVPIMKPPTPEEHTKPCNNETQGKKLIKPSELPIYSIDDNGVEHPSIVEKKIREIRQSVTAVKVVLDGVFLDISNTFKYLDNIKFAVDYLQDEANLIPRIGAVGIGGLSGLVLSLRRGIPTKLVATTAGASIVGCICFPKEAQQVANTLGHYRNITFNFIFGVFGRFQESNLSDTHYVSFLHTKEDSKSLESVTMKETSTTETSPIQNSKKSKSLKTKVKEKEETDISDEQMAQNWKNYRKMTKTERKYERSLKNQNNDDEPLPKKPKFLKPQY